MIRIKVNGKDWQAGPETTVGNLLSRLKISSHTCAVEKNGEVVSKANYGQVVLEDGDQLEVVRFMAGG